MSAQPGEKLTEDDRRAYEDVRRVYDKLGDDSRYAKTQQWLIANYGIALLAAIFAFGHGTAGTFCRVALGGLAGLTGIVACWAICGVQRDLIKYREWTDELLGRKGDRIPTSARIDPRVAEMLYEGYRTYWTVDLSLVLLAVVVIATVLVAGDLFFATR
ncbi:MAG: hypothetical protein WD014_06005 [Dongiaceae bacterium]